MNSKLLGAIRHILTGAGGALASYGVIGEGQIELIVGAVLTIAGFVASFLAPEKQQGPSS